MVLRKVLYRENSENREVKYIYVLCIYTEFLCNCVSSRDVVD